MMVAVYTRVFSSRNLTYGQSEHGFSPFSDIGDSGLNLPPTFLGRYGYARQLELCRKRSLKIRLGRGILLPSFALLRPFSTPQLYSFGTHSTLFHLPPATEVMPIHALALNQASL